MTILTEEKQSFSFSNQWHVFKYDAKESGYFAISNAIEGTKAVDFLGLHGDNVYVFEVKDFRGYRIQNKKRLSQGDLAKEVAQKVRDTMCGIYAGARQLNAAGRWADLSQRIADPDTAVKVILWLEDDHSSIPGRLNELQVQAQLIKAKLKWLKVKVFAVSQATHSDTPPGLTVSNLPGAGGLS